MDGAVNHRLSLLEPHKIYYLHSENTPMNNRIHNHQMEISDRIRAAFEAGIKLGGIFHQFTGTPVSSSNAEVLEKAMVESVKIQPFVKEVDVRIDRKMLEERCKKGTGKIGDGYTTLTGEMLIVNLTVSYGDVVVKARMKYEKSLNYPLMSIEF